MKPHLINCIIAEWMGFDGIFKDDDGVYCGFFLPGNISRPLPNYHGDLNAIHEVLVKLDLFNHGMFRQRLREVVSRNQIDRRWNKRDYLDATAPQRCEALLRTLNLWRES